ncbi:DUF624 domain-containing protein [Ruania suaedae]|uniref:DUF624 domain-containing protein n=1 Tax=Ruania suaedae TaxID=2897774 RepID=UPI001E4DA487|nr:DUF624 domain-containing protein [Ruania suaedae]UFU03777.1 DUF624 domain-containing protein [Ruania suaedae]
MTSLQAALVRFLEGAYRIVTLHLLWLAGVLLGAVVLGAGPATAAAYATLRTLQREPDFSARRAAVRFAHHYRRSFWRANAYTWVVAVVGAVLLASQLLAAQLPGPAGAVSRAASISGLLAWVIMLVHLPAVTTARAPRGLVEDLRAALLYGIAAFPVTLMLLVAVGAMVLAVATMPALVLVLGPALTAEASIRGERVLRRRRAVTSRRLAVR